MLSNFTAEDHDVVDDEDEEILTIKRRNIKIDPLIEEDEIQFKKKKSVTKAAVAKKILKKNIVPNKKINFDENGQVRQLLVYLIFVD